MEIFVKLLWNLNRIIDCMAFCVQILSWFQASAQASSAQQSPQRRNHRQKPSPNKRIEHLSWVSRTSVFSFSFAKNSTSKYQCSLNFYRRSLWSTRISSKKNTVQLHFIETASRYSEKIGQNPLTKFQQALKENYVNIAEQSSDCYIYSISLKQKTGQVYLYKKYIPELYLQISFC